MDELIDSSSLPKREIRGRDKGLPSSECNICLIEEFCLFLLTMEPLKHFEQEVAVGRFPF